MSGNERPERWNLLLAMLAERGRLSVSEACAELDVSEATIRRDFGEIAAQQLATRTHGGIVATTVAYDLPVRYRASGADAAKNRIADLAASQVRLGAVVGLNGGTTTSAVGRFLAARDDVNSGAMRPALTVVTNALNIASELVLRPAIRCISLGGTARTESYELTGAMTMRSLQDLWMDVLFLGVDGISPDSGASCRHDDEAAVNTAMARQSGRVVVICTGEKVGKRSFASIRPVSGIHELITDPSAPKDALAALADQGVRITLVEAVSETDSVTDVAPTDAAH